jgi:hypothetical protein
MDVRVMGWEFENWFIWLRIRTNRGYCEHGNNEPSGSTKAEEVLDWLRDY